MNPKNTKARFGCLLQPVAWKCNWSILEGVVKKSKQSKQCIAV